MTMKCSKATTILNEGLILKPGWQIEATDAQHRFEGGIHVKVHYPCRNLNEDQAAAGYPEEIVTYASFLLQSGLCANDLDLYRSMILILLRIEEHEWREAFRVRTTLEAPFHPHRVDGMAAWGSPSLDATFGAV